MHSLFTRNRRCITPTMSAGFSYRDRTYWGTNGAVELCLDKLIEIAAERGWQDDSIAALLYDTRESFNMGCVVPLDEIVTNETSRIRFTELLGAAIQRLREDGELTEYGLSWVRSTLSELHAALSISNCD